MESLGNCSAGVGDDGDATSQMDWDDMGKSEVPVLLVLAILLVGFIGSLIIHADLIFPPFSCTLLLAGYCLLFSSLGRTWTPFTTVIVWIKRFFIVIQLTLMVLKLVCRND